MTPELLTAIGQVLFGNPWQSQLARALGVNDRTVRGWLQERRGMPSGLAGDLRWLCLGRQRELAEALTLLEQASNDQGGRLA